MVPPNHFNAILRLCVAELSITVNYCSFIKYLLFFPLQSVIFYTVKSPKLDQWLRNETLYEQLTSIHDPQYVDVDRSFYHNIDEDYDLRQGGISKTSFLNCYLSWIQYCAYRKDPVRRCLHFNCNLLIIRLQFEVSKR